MTEETVCTVTLPRAFAETAARLLEHEAGYEASCFWPENREACRRAGAVAAAIRRALAAAAASPGEDET